MGGLNTQNSRIQLKYSTVTGATPTIAPSTDHTDGTWTENDIYIGEVYINVQDDTVFYRSLNGIIPITSGTTTINTTTFVNKTGDTMTGPLFTPTLSANTISATTIYSPSFNGTFIGDGSQLTGITSTTFTGGTVSGPVIFTSDVNLCGAAVTVSELSGCGGTIDVYSVINALDAISATTFYGDGSNLTNLPYFSGITLDSVLALGDTSVSGNINLSGGSITLGTGTFYGDGSGLINIPFGPTPTLDEVLLSGNTSTNGDILLTNGDIILGNGTYYGDGSGLTGVTDTYVTGGTYSSGTAIFTNNYGTTFEVSGFTTGGTSSQTLAETLVNGNATSGTSINLNGGDQIISDDSQKIIEFQEPRILIQNQYNPLNVTGFLEVKNDTATSQLAHIFDDGGGSTISSAVQVTDSTATIISNNQITTNEAFVRADSGSGTVPQAEVRISTSDFFGNTSYMIFNPGMIEVTGANSDGFAGIQYAGDYSADFTNLSLVTKQYVDGAITVATSATTATLSQVLANGNTTDGNDIVITSGDTISAGPFLIQPQLANGPLNTWVFTDDNGAQLSQYFNFRTLDGYGGWDTTWGTGAADLSTNFTRISQNKDDITIELVASTTDYGSGVYIGPADLRVSQSTTGSTKHIRFDGALDYIEVATDNNQGMRYIADYSANFVDETLVTKRYVDAAITGATTGSSSTLAQVLTNGNVTGGNDIELTLGDTILLSPSGSTNTANRIVTVDNGSGNYDTRILTNYDNGTSYGVDQYIDIDNNVGFSVLANETYSGAQQSWVYTSFGGNGIQLAHQNKTTTKQYSFYTQNEGYTPGGGGEADYGVKSYEWIGDTFKVQKSRSAELGTGNSQVMWRSESLSAGHIAQYTINVFGRKPSDMSEAQTSTIKFAVGWTTNKLPYLIGTELVEAFSTFSVVDYTISLDTTFNAGRVLLTLNNTEAFSIDYSVRVEELIKQPVAY